MAIRPMRLARLLATMSVAWWCCTAAPVLAEGAPHRLGALLIRGGGSGPLHLVRIGDRLVLDARGRHLTTRLFPPDLGSAVQARSDGGRLVIQLPHGSVVQSRRLGRNLVVDLFDPAQVGASASGGIAAMPSPEQREGRDDPASARLVPDLPTPFEAAIVGGDAAPTMAPPAMPEPSDGGKAPANRKGGAGAPADDPRRGEDAPTAVASAQFKPIVEDGARCVPLPFAMRTGVAILSRSSSASIFLDVAAPISKDTLDALGLGAASRTDDVAQTTEIEVPLPPGRAVRLDRSPAGLCLSRVPATSAGTASIPVRSDRTALHFAMEEPGRTLTVRDPETRALILVGMDRGSAGAIPAARHSALFTIKPTNAGLVVEPLADRLGLRREAAGFALALDDGSSLATRADFGTVPADQADALTRSMHLPNEASPLLAARAQEQLRAAALAPERARLPARIAEAEALLSLGLGPEAATVLDAAFADDPSAETDDRARLLRAVAGLAADRDGARSQMRQLSTPTTDEERLWRSLAWRAEDGRPEADAAVIRHDMPLLLSYPASLRAVAADLAAPVLLASDDPDTIRAVRLLPAAGDAALAAATAEARLGNPKAALASLDGLSRSRDPHLMAEALLARTRLEARGGEQAPVAAADLLAAHRLDWRLAGVEPEAILEEADDRMRGQEAKRGFDLLREAVWRYPSLRDEVGRRLAAGLRSLLDPAVSERIPPGDFVSIVENNRDAVAADPVVAASIGPALADRLEALDLGPRAADILSDMMTRLPPGTARAVIGTRVAALREDAGAPDAAESALLGSEAPDLPPDLLARRRCIKARILDDRHAPDAALALLGAADDDPSLRLRAKILTERKDWHGAKLALDAAFERLPASGELDRRDGALVLQLAAVALRDGDTRMTSRVAAEADRRLSDPEERESLRLAAAPLQASSASP